MIRPSRQYDAPITTPTLRKFGSVRSGQGLVHAAVRRPLDRPETIQYCAEDVECFFNGGAAAVVQPLGRGLEHEEELEGRLFHVFYAGQRRDGDPQKRL